MSNTENIIICSTKTAENPFQIWGISVKITYLKGAATLFSKKIVNGPWLGLSNEVLGILPAQRAANLPYVKLKVWKNSGRDS